MGAIGFFVLWVGYAVFYYGFDQIRGGNNGFLDLALPGHYKALPTDAQLGGGSSASNQGPQIATGPLPGVPTTQPGSAPPALKPSPGVGVLGTLGSPGTILTPIGTTPAPPSSTNTGNAG